MKVLKKGTDLYPQSSLLWMELVKQSATDIEKVELYEKACECVLEGRSELYSNYIEWAVTSLISSQIKTIFLKAMKVTNDEKLVIKYINWIANGDISEFRCVVEKLKRDGFRKKEFHVRVLAIELEQTHLSPSHITKAWENVHLSDPSSVGT